MSSARSHKRQNEILKAAENLFFERGYDAVALDDILERVGGSKTTLYSYYGCKEGLFAATVKKICEDKLSALLAVDVADLDPKAGLSEIGKQFLLILTNPKGHLFYRTMIAEASRFPDLAFTFYAAGPEAVIRILRRNIEHWQEKGLLRCGNSETLATQFIGLLMGNLQMKTLLGIMPPLTERQRQIWVSRGVELFLEGARAR